MRAMGRSVQVLRSLVRPKPLSERFEAPAALDDGLGRKRVGGLRQRFTIPLDRISSQIATIERHVSRAIGRERFAAFVHRVRRQLAGGRGSFLPGEPQ